MEQAMQIGSDNRNNYNKLDETSRSSNIGEISPTKDEICVVEQDPKQQNTNPSYHFVSKEEFESIPDFLISSVNMTDILNDSASLSNQNKEQIVHVLPTLKLKERPIIIEKEIEYERPIVIHQKIIHKDISIIIEKPIIKQKHEHYKLEPEIIINTQHIHDQDIIEENINNTNTDGNEIEKLRLLRTQQYMDNTPIVSHEKQHIQLNTEFREASPQIEENKIVYEQPVEIEAMEIEKIKPTIIEELTVEKEHIHQKSPPNIHVNDATMINEGHKYFEHNDDKRRKCCCRR